MWTTVITTKNLSVLNWESKMKSRFQMVWDEIKLSDALGVNVNDVREYLTDGRRVSFIIERRLVWENSGWKLAQSEGAGYDLIDPDGAMWEVRSITNNGVYFNPSNQVGSGRYFDEDGFFSKLKNIKGFILTDVVTFPSIDVFVVPVENVIRWYKENILGKNTKVSREKFLHKLQKDIKF